MLMNAARGSLFDYGERIAVRACGLPRVRLRAGDSPDDPAIHADVIFREVPGRDGADRWLAVDQVLWCGSARCPRCAPHVASRLSDRVAGLLAAAKQRGVAVAFATFTAWHDATVPLADLSVLLRESWSALQRGGLWRRLKRDGLIGIVRTWEATWGPATGWHPHAHALVLHKHGPEAAAAAGRDLVRRWLDLLAAAGWKADPAAQDVRAVTDGVVLGDYGSKALRGWGAAAELARGWAKDGKRPNRFSVPQLLALAAVGDQVASARYAEAVMALRGQRLLVVGPSIKAALGLDDVADLADGDELELEAQEGEVVGDFPGHAWVKACDRRMAPWVIAQVKKRWRDLPWSVFRGHLVAAIELGPDPPDG